MPNDQQWQEWAQKAQAGDKAAYHSLLREIDTLVRKSIAGSLANPEWVDDIAQDVLISVHKSLYTYSPDRPFRPWLMAIVHFRRTDYLRRHYAQRSNRKISIDSEDFVEQPVTEAPPIGELKDVENALNALPEQQRQVFKLMKIDGYTAQEVADRLGMTESAVKVSAHRTLNKLKSQLQ